MTHPRRFGWSNVGWIVTPDDNPFPRMHLFRWPSLRRARRAK